MILSKEILEVQEKARRIAEEEFTKDVLDEIESSGTFPRRILERMRDDGLTGLKVPKEYGGTDLGNLAYVVALEELTRKCAIAGVYLQNPNSNGSGPLLLYGTEEQKEKYLPKVVDLEIRICFALTEPEAGSDVSGMATLAEKVDGGYLLNGRKCFISGAQLADYAVLFAKTDKYAGAKGISAFLVDLHAPGVSRGLPEHKMGLAGYPIGDIILEDVFIPAEDLIGEENKGFVNAMKTLDNGRLAVAGISLGVARGCLEEAIKFAKQTEHNGRPLAKQQAVSFMLADMNTKVTAMRELVYSAAQLKDAGDPQAGVHASMAKYFCSETCNQVAAAALQIHGEYGYMKGSEIERKYRDCRVFTIFEGSSQIQQMIIAGQMLR
ncbi:MAG: acyl-CoA dehydrogenase family protein [Firmicutes bacterium]|nr:acyl-CoA dehydrogenase family protein [Bacillota bacterium]MBR6236169.1 acyl-CoA dehydrogenase family protein [Bacillota bacterium]